jgi:SAM-dependent methyltransferase
MMSIQALQQTAAAMPVSQSSLSLGAAAAAELIVRAEGARALRRWLTLKESCMDHAGGDEAYAFVADLYDHVVPYRERQDVAFFVEAAQESGGPVLEIGCGTGRILIPTARAGIEVVGLDLSPRMLKVCRERVQREPEDVQSRIQLVQADMRSFRLTQRFKLVTMPFRPFQHLTTVDDQLSCLVGIHRHLVEDGSLILDVFNPSLEALVRDNLGQEFGDEPEFTTPDGRRVIRRHKIVSKDSFNQIKITSSFCTM